MKYPVDLEKSQGMKGKSDPIWTRTLNISNISNIFGPIVIFHTKKKTKEMYLFDPSTIWQDFSDEIKLH